MPFKFRLATVLRVRRIEEDLAKNALMEAIAGLKRAEAVMDARRRHLESLSLGFGIRAYSAFQYEGDEVNRAVQAVSFAKEEVTANAAIVEEARGAYLLAKQRTSSLEKLETRQSAEYEAAYERQLGAVIDDISASRWVRRNLEEKSA